MRPLFLLLATLVTLSDAIAQSPAAKLRVATRNLEPFSFDKDGRRVGFATELWDQLSRETGHEYEIQVVNSA
jgi:hypothetical protein